MTDDLEELTEDEKLRLEALKLVDIPPEIQPDAVGLPDDVRDEEIDDDNLAGADED